MKKAIFGILLVLILFTASSSLFVIYEGEQAIVTRFGKPVGEVRYAGLNWKLPLIEEVFRFERRMLKWDGDPNQITTKEKKFIWVDVTARWKIVDPLKFYTTVATVSGAQSRLDDIIDSVVRDAVSGNYLVDLVRGSTYQGSDDVRTLAGETRRNRDEILGNILKKASVNTLEYGIELVDVLIKRLNYVEKVRERVYERMVSERNKVAAEYRSEGEGIRAEILGEMGKELKRIESEAYRKAEEIKGQADAEAARIYAEAYGADPEFYSFYRTLEAMDKTIKSNSKLVISTESDFYRYLKSPSK
jgi:membrane protease subunit HflC